MHGCEKRRMQLGQRWIQSECMAAELGVTGARSPNRASPTHTIFFLGGGVGVAAATGATLNSLVWNAGRWRDRRCWNGARLVGINVRPCISANTSEADLILPRSCAFRSSIARSGTMLSL